MRGSICLGALVIGGAAALTGVVLWVAPHPPAPRYVLDFQRYSFGVAPGEFDYDATGSHGPALAAGRPMWRTYIDLFAPSPKLALIQASAVPRLDHFPIALLREISAANLMLFTYIKPMGGDLRQSAGLIWRARDRDNYYAALLDARESRLLVLKMIRGRPQEIATAPAPMEVEFQRSTPSPTRGWYTLRVESIDDRIRVWVQGERKLSIRDSTLHYAGRVGLITHADSVALFDNFEVQTGRRGFIVPNPPSRPEPTPAPTLHVAEVVPTDALYRRPARAFSSGDVYWRVLIRDSHDNPVPAARVQVDVVGPDGTVHARLATMTGSDGLALFRYSLREHEHAGVFMVRVNDVSHADRDDARYDAATNVASSATFLVSTEAGTGGRNGGESR